MSPVMQNDPHQAITQLKMLAKRHRSTCRQNKGREAPAAERFWVVLGGVLDELTVAVWLPTAVAVALASADNGVAVPVNETETAWEAKAIRAAPKPFCALLTVK
jgi:hypothetical protein